MNKIYFMRAYNIDPSTKCGTALNSIGLPVGHSPHNSDNPNRPEHILTEDELSGISGRLDSLIRSPRASTINNILQYAKPKDSEDAWMVIAYTIICFCLGAASAALIFLLL